VATIHADSEQRCGYRRVHAMLARAGVRTGLGLVRDQPTTTSGFGSEQILDDGCQ